MLTRRTTQRKAAADISDCVPKSIQRDSSSPPLQLRRATRAARYHDLRAHFMLANALRLDFK